MTDKKEATFASCAEYPDWCRWRGQTDQRLDDFDEAEKRTEGRFEEVFKRLNRIDVRLAVLAVLGSLIGSGIGAFLAVTIRKSLEG